MNPPPAEKEAFVNSAFSVPMGGVNVILVNKTIKTTS